MKLIRSCLALTTILVVSSCSQAPAPGTDAPAGPTAAEVAQSPAKPMSVRTSDVRLAENTPHIGTCNIETANDKVFEPQVPSASRNKTITVVGWLVDDVAKAVPGKVVLRLQSSDDGRAWEQDVSTWGARSDVATKYGNEAYANSGFTVPLDVAALPIGDYAVYIAFPGGKGKGEVECGVGRHLQLTD